MRNQQVTDPIFKSKQGVTNIQVQLKLRKYIEKIYQIVGPYQKKFHGRARVISFGFGNCGNVALEINKFLDNKWNVSPRSQIEFHSYLFNATGFANKIAVDELESRISICNITAS